MRAKYSVTFEFDSQPPKTHRGIVSAGQASTCMSRAVRQAQAALKPKNWASMVCVILERLDRAEEAE